MSLRNPGKEYKGGLFHAFQERELHLNLKIVFGAVILLGLIFSVIILPKVILKEPQGIGWSIKSPRLTQSQILSICSRQPLTRDFISRNHPSYKTEIVFLDKETIQNMAQESPAIYADLPHHGVYKVEYSAEEGGVILLLDPEKKKVVKYYRVMSLSFL